MKTILTSLTLALLLAPALQAGDHKKPALSSEERRIQAVSYTHLTLPTICSV